MNAEYIKEFREIRKKFKASRKQFGTVFIGKSEATVINYERGRTEIPEPVMRLARTWEKFLDNMNGEIK
jgi:DNA-binding transcriptional regulator YiaG